ADFPSRRSLPEIPTSCGIFRARGPASACRIAASCGSAAAISASLQVARSLLRPVWRADAPRMPRRARRPRAASDHEMHVALSRARAGAVMDLTTRYLGLELAHPFMPGASPLDDPDIALRLEDAGASALVMHSLFEEDIQQYAPTTDAYLERLVRLKRRLQIPVIASLNGTTAAGWLRYAMALQQGGADA